MKRKHAIGLLVCLHFVTLVVFVGAKLQVNAFFFQLSLYLCRQIKVKHSINKKVKRDD